MPSFARANNPSADPLGALEDIWKNKEVDVVADLMRDSRLRAATILRKEIPAKMLGLRELIKSINDESSPFWKGHVHQGDYVKPTMMFHNAASGLTSPATAASRAAGDVDGLSGGVAKMGVSSPIQSHSAHPYGDVKSPTDRPSVPSPIVLPEDVAGVYPTTTIESAKEAVEAKAQEAGTAGTVQGMSTSTEALAERKVTMGGHWFEVVPRNKIQSQCIEIALREFEEMYDMINELKLWLEMEIPVIEDGNSFGTEIQQHLINQLLNANKAIVAWENAVRQHYTDRAKYVSEWVKTPNVEDWALTIASSDRFDHHLIRGYLCRALTTYAGLLTKFERNWEKVVFPKGKQGPASVGMY